MNLVPQVNPTLQLPESMVSCYVFFSLTLTNLEDSVAFSASSNILIISFILARIGGGPTQIVFGFFFHGQNLYGDSSFGLEIQGYPMIYDGGESCQHHLAIEFILFVNSLPPVQFSILYVVKACRLECISPNALMGYIQT